MGRITKLPDDLANQIAAGEVVERPASVIKELVENAIDAEATRITITTEYGGKKLIRVEDDGFGMDPDDARLSLERHATSKIRRADDLGAIVTLGFRGEALPSMASVSHFRMRTRPRGVPSGTEIRVNAGLIESVMEAGGPEGTLIEVADLFYNLPGAPQVPQVGRGRERADFEDRDAAGVVLPAGRLRADQRRPQGRGVSAGGVGVGPALPAVRRSPGPGDGRAGVRRHPHPRLHRGAGGARTHARAAARLRQPAHRQGQDDRARHFRRLRGRLQQGTQPRSAPVPRGASRSHRCQRASDQGRGPVPRAVAGARSGAARRRRRVGTCAGAGIGPAAVRPDCRAPAGAEHSRRAGRRVLPEPVGGAHGPPARADRWRGAVRRGDVTRGLADRGTVGDRCAARRGRTGMARPRWI
jgi:hypothetical protein